MPKNNGFQQPPFFVRGSISETGLTVQVIDEDGHAHTFHVDEALALLEARRYATRYGPLAINTHAFTDIAAEADSELVLWGDSPSR